MLKIFNNFRQNMKEIIHRLLDDSISSFSPSMKEGVS
jgi:hypothetical protein